MSTKKYAQLPLDMEKAITTNAGLILSDFNPEAPGEEDAIREKILYATTGGVSVSCVATYKDWGEDIDNCPKNTKEMMRVESWECKIGGTALTVTADTAANEFGAADKNAGTTDKELVIVKPRMTVKPEDFKVLWYVCPYGTEGGFVAVKLENALNKGGFSMKSSDKDKGQFAFDYTGHTSINEPDAVPFTFYLKKSATAAAQNVSVT